MSLRAAHDLGEAAGRRVRVMDLRWLKPLNREALAAAAQAPRAVLVVDEGRRTGGIAEEIFTALDEVARTGLTRRRITGEDTYIPLGPAAETVLPSQEQISRTMREMLDD